MSPASIICLPPAANEGTFGAESGRPFVASRWSGRRKNKRARRVQTCVTTGLKEVNSTKILVAEDPSEVKARKLLAFADETNNRGSQSETDGVAPIVIYGNPIYTREYAGDEKSDTSGEGRL